MSGDKKLSLDPGTPSRRKSISGCKCLLITVVVLFSIGVILFLVNIAKGAVRLMSDPHRALFQNTSLEEGRDRGSVVQPLISRDQTFDVVATVWLRSMQGIDHVAMAGKIRRKNNSSLREGNGTPLLEEEVQEVALFSDIMFRGLRLTDEKIFGTINYTLPTALFRNANLSNYDVRGSFMLIPSSPSLLDHLSNYTTWIPDVYNPFPVRSWPFPLGSSQNNNKTLVDNAIETFGISVPLVEFHNIKSQCVDTQINADEKDDDDDDDDYQKKQAADEASLNKVVIKTVLSGTRGKPVLETHPYVITRTHIHVIDETRLFNRQAYFKAHKALRAKSCGRNILGVKPSRYTCVATYLVNGHWGTQLKLDVLNETTGVAQTEWAYAPYIHATQGSLGPKYLRAVPVNRENCTMTQTESSQRSFEEDEYMNITWKVSYSGRTPFKSAALSALFLLPKTNMSESDRSQALVQDNAEVLSGIVGYQSDEGIQPKRRALLWAIEFVLNIIIVVLNIRYWYTRTSTTSISILGNALQASAFIFFDIGTVVTDWKNSDISVVMRFFQCIELFSPSFLVIKVIARIEFGWWSDKSWVPIVYIADATHRERASKRLEARTSLRSKVVIFLLIGMSYYFLAPHDYHVIAARLPPPAPGDLKTTRFDELWPFVFHPMHLTGQILQLLFNQRSKTYAGGHRVSAVLTLVLYFVQIAVFVPSLVGRVDARDHLSAHYIVDTVVLLVMCWQAVTLPGVPQILEDEHTE